MTENDGSAELRVHGGSGIRSGLRDLETGLKNGWAIPAETLAAVPQRILEFIERGSRREATAAVRVLLSMLKHNAELEPSTSVVVERPRVI